MNKKNVLNFVLIILLILIISSVTSADTTDGNKSENSWVEATNVKFDGRIGFQQTTMGTMDSLIAKYKKGEKGVKIFATGKIVDINGNTLEVFNDVPANIITIKGSDYYQFDKSNWRFRSSTNPHENYKKVFKRKY